MNILQLVSAVNAARAKADHEYRSSDERLKGLLASSVIIFHFNGARFQTEVPYALRLTKGVVLDQLNRKTYLIVGKSRRRVSFRENLVGDIVWSPFK